MQLLMTVMIKDCVCRLGWQGSVQENIGVKEEEEEEDEEENVN